MALHSPILPLGTPCAEGDLPGIALCAGVGGLELGLHLAEPGYRTVCYVERDAFAAATLVARMADQALDDAPVWSDLRTFDGRPWRGKVRLISAGYPCQPFSSAGRKRGKDDPRHLWPEVARIASEVEPEFLFLENVEGHLNLGLPDVLGELRRMGFTPQAGLFAALEVGASHLRRRIFILAHADRHLEKLEPGGHRTLAEGPAIPAGDRPGRQAGLADAGSADLDDALHAAQADRDDAEGTGDIPLFAPPPFDLAAWDAVLDRRPDLQPELFGLDDGLADRLERSHAAGNGVVPLAAARAWKTLLTGLE